MIYQMLRAAAIVTAFLAGCGRSGFAPTADGSGSDSAADTEAALTYRAAMMADSPLGYWRLGDTGSVAKDETGNFDGSYSGGCSPGQPGALAVDTDTAVTFDGTTCEIILPTGLAISGTSPLTIELWAKTVAASDYEHFFTREIRSGAIPEDGFGLYQQTGTGVSFERAVTGTNVTTPGVEIAAGSFVYLVATYDGLAEVLYIDGAVAASKADTRALNAITVAPLIGAHPTGAFFHGTLDEVAIYDHVLAPDRIALHRAIALSGPQ